MARRKSVVALGRGPVQLLQPDALVLRRNVEQLRRWSSQGNALEVRRRLDELVADRIRLAAPVAAVAFLLLGLVGGLQQVQSRQVVSLAVGSAQAALLVLEGRLLGIPALRRHSTWLGIVVGGIVAMLIALEAWYSQAPTVAAVQFAVVVLVVPAVLPWGVQAQFKLAVLFLAAFLATLAATVGVFEGLATSWGVVVLVALLVSLPVAHKIQRVHREVITHSLAEEELGVLYRELVERASEAIYRTDVNGRIVFANPAAAGLFGVEERELLGRSFFEFVALRSRDEVQRFYQEQYRQRISKTFREIVVVDRAGQEKWVSQTAQLYWQGSYVAGFHMAARDITDRVRIVEQLRQSEARFRSTFERAPIGIALVAPDGRFLQVNAALCAMLGYSEEELLRGNFQSITHPEDLEPDLALVNECLEGKRDTYVMEKRYIRRDGQVLTARLLVGLVRDSFGLPVHFVSLIEDITERKRLERELQRAKEAAEQATRAKTLFLARMSHEIRTPLSGVLGMLDLLRESGLNEEQRTYVETAIASGETLLALLNDLLDLSRIETGAIELRPEPVNIVGLMDELYRGFQPKAERQGLQFELRIEPDLPRVVRVDGRAVRQIALNFVSNALKFTNRGSVVIEVRWEGAAGGVTGQLHLVVRDTGPGIAPADLEEIFSDFGQTEAGRRLGGAGLGLAIARRLGEAMGGRVWAESELGSGSAFHASLPVEAIGNSVEVGLEDRQVVPQNGVHDRSEAARVLVVEDHPVNQLVLRRLLEKVGHEVEVAPDGAAALSVLETAEERFDLLLVDLQMPNVNGLELTREIRTREAGGMMYARRGGRVPIVVLTAHAWTDDRQRCLEAGADAYLAKPVQAQILYGVVGKLIGTRSGTSKAANAPDVVVESPY